MYESPIKIFQDQIRREMENGVMKAVQRYNIDVDKEELLKALQYDRDQYSKGYEDGLNANKWVPVSERLPETDKNRKYLVCGEKGGIYIAEFVCNTVHGKPLGTSWWTAHGRYCPKPIAWMPLPEPYKGVEE